MKIDALSDMITPGLYKVEVWDRDNPTDREFYDIKALSEREAAFKGIDRFQTERTGNGQEK